MTASDFPKAGLQALLRPEESILVLMDHQPFQFANLHSHDPTMVVNNAVGLAKAAKVFGVPTILTTVVRDRGGHLIQGIQNVFPEQVPIDRTFINAWEDSRVVEAVRRTGRTKLILAGLWTEICLALPAIQAVGEGYQVYAVTDASGGVTREAHDNAVHRMVAAGVVPITWLAVVGELQRDWARGATANLLGEVFAGHAGGTGIALVWEQQLLSEPSEHQAAPAPEPAVAR